jgi:uncharacterized protein YdeI (YjbR/CyaY-like superfamily)
MVSFESQDAWAVWLEKHHGTSPGVWLRIAKKSSGIASVSYPEALEIALCYGWIDGQKRPESESTWLQRFTPRGPRSPWSKINRDKAEALIREGRMAPAGLASIEAAKKDGRWDRAYASPSRAEVPDDLRVAFQKKPKAKAFFETLDSRNRYAVLYRIHMANKPETRAKRIEQFVAMLAKGEKLHE